MNGAGVSTVHGGDQVHGLIPLRADALEIDVGEADGAQALGNFGTARQEQVTVLERFQARTQVETEHLGQGHGEVGIAVGVDRELRDLDLFVAHDAFNGGAGLTLFIDPK